MIRLVWKDLVIQKQVVRWLVLYVVIFSISFRNLGEFQPLAIISALGYLLVMYGGAWEEKNDTDKLWNSLPVPRWKIVGAKYLSGLAYTLIAAGLTLVAFTVLPLIGFPMVAGAVRPAILALGALVVLVVSSLYWPLYFALGYTKARYWNFLTFFGFFFVVGALPKLLFPQGSVPLPEVLNPFPIIAGAVAGSLLLTAVSFWISLRLYTRREF